MNMSEETRSYIAIDLKSFYASVECADLGRDPLTTNLVVADVSRTEKTICLAVSPSLKAYGIPGRARLFEVVAAVRQANRERQRRNGGRDFAGSSDDAEALERDPGLELAYIAAKPRMSRYMEVSTKIYNIYLNYVAPEDIHVYSVDEVFIDVTDYLKTYGLSPRELAVRMIKDVLTQTGITATAGIGTNLYLCKIAMDIVAKHVPPDKDGVRIGELNEESYRKQLWCHRPLTDFWRVGKGIARKLEKHGMFTMGDVAACSVGEPSDYHNEELLYRLFGVNAELLIDHAWGYEPCRISDVKAYKPESNSLGHGQVLQEPYTYDKGRLIVWEMADVLVLELVSKGLMTDQIILTIGYDVENLRNPELAGNFKGETHTDFYGREVPKHAHGTANLGKYSSSTKEILDAVTELYDRITDSSLLIRRVNVTANHVISEKDAAELSRYEQMDLFTDYRELAEKERKEEERLKKEKSIQHALIDIKNKYGKNAILKGSNFVEGAMTRERNAQIGGHKA